jgi:vancomycin resistance protein YoaR
MSEMPVRRILIVGVSVALLAAGGGIAGYANVGDVPRGTTVLGVDLGAKSRHESERLLAERLAARAGEPVNIDLDGRRITLAPAGIELSVDVDATVGKAMRGVPRLSGGRDSPPVIRVSHNKLGAALRKRIEPAHITFVKPGITYAGLIPRPVYPVAGLALDTSRAVAAVKRAWLTPDAASVPLTGRTPATTRAQVDALIAGLAAPAVAAPVTITVGANSFTLQPRAIARGLVFRADNAGRLTPTIDADALRAAAPAEFAAVEAAPASAVIGRTVVATTAGSGVDMTKLGRDLLAVLPKPAPRHVSATLARREGDRADADLAVLGVQERVSTFTTYFTGGSGSPRSQNIVTVARAVDGAIVRPGATFSLNGHTGERTYAKGYRNAPVIVGGNLELGIAGGASQFTTTLFNAAYYAGLQDVEHKPHSFYFTRYPAVIESTIFYPTLDLKFRNTTPYAILIDTSSTARSVTVSMWSTKVYDGVATVRGPRRHPTWPPTVYREPGPGCITSSGLPGFTQDAWRVIRKDGQEVEREKFTWRYDPEPRFVCGAPPDGKAPGG